MPGRQKKRPSSPHPDDATSIAQSRTRRARRSSVAASESDSHDSYQRRRAKRTKTTNAPSTTTSRRKRAGSTSESAYDDESSHQAEESIEAMVNRIRRERAEAPKPHKKQVTTRRSSKTGIVTRRASLSKTESGDKEDAVPEQPGQKLKLDSGDGSTKRTDKEKDIDRDDPADGDTKKKDQLKSVGPSESASEGKETIDLTGDTSGEVSVSTVASPKGALPPAAPLHAATKPAPEADTATKPAPIEDIAAKTVVIKDSPADPDRKEEENVVRVKDRTGQKVSESTLDDKTKGSLHDTIVDEKTRGDKEKRLEQHPVHGSPSNSTAPPTKEDKKVPPKKLMNMDVDHKLAPKATGTGLSEQTIGSASKASGAVAAKTAHKSKSSMPVSNMPISAEEKSSTEAKMATTKEAVVPQRKSSPGKLDPTPTKGNGRASADKTRSELSVGGGAKIGQAGESRAAATDKSEAKALPHSSGRNMNVHSRKADAAMVGASLSPPPTLFKHQTTKSLTKPAIVDLTGEDDSEENSHRPATDAGLGNKPPQKDTKVKDTVAAKSPDNTLTEPKLMQGPHRSPSRLPPQTDASKALVPTADSKAGVLPGKAPSLAKREEQKDYETRLKESQSKTNPSTKPGSAGSEPVPVIATNSEERVKAISTQKPGDNDTEETICESVKTPSDPHKKPVGAQKSEPTVATRTAREESSPTLTKNEVARRKEVINAGEQIAPTPKEVTKAAESVTVAQIQVDGGISGSLSQVTATGELARRGNSEMIPNEQSQSSHPLQFSGAKRKERAVSTAMDEKITAPVQSAKHQEENSSIPPKSNGTEAGEVAASNQSSMSSIGISKSSDQDQSTGIKGAIAVDGDIVSKSLTTDVASEVKLSKKVPVTDVQVSGTEKQDTAVSMQIGEDDEKGDQTNDSGKRTETGENTDAKTTLASTMDPTFLKTTANAPEPKSHVKPSTNPNALILNAEINLGKPGAPSSAPTDVTAHPKPAVALLPDPPMEAVKPQPLVQEDLCIAQLAEPVHGIVSPKEGSTAQSNVLLRPTQQAPPAAQLTEATVVDEAARAKLQPANTLDAHATQENETPKSTASRDFDILNAQRQVPSPAVEKGVNLALPTESHDGREVTSHNQPNHRSGFTTMHEAEPVEQSQDLRVAYQSVTHTAVLRGSMLQSSGGDVGNTVATNDTEEAPGTNPSQVSLSNDQEPLSPAEPESLAAILQQPSIRSFANEDAMEDNTPDLATRAVENVAMADEHAASSQPSSDQTDSSDQGQKRRISTGDSCNEPAESSKRQRISDEPLERVPSPVKVVRVDLARLKSLIFATGRRVHNGTRYWEVFLKYWTALSRRLCENLSSEQFKQCQAEIKSFLKSKKLRVLHNKLILDVSTMPDSLRQRMTTRNPQRTDKSRESENRRSLIARPKSDSRTVQPIKRTGMKPNLGSSRIPGSLAIDPYLRKSTASTGMKITENAVWLVSIAMREYAKSLLSDTLLTAKAMDSGVVPPIPKIDSGVVPPIPKMDSGVVPPIPKIETKVQTMQQPSPSLPIDRSLKRPESSKFLLPSDFHTMVEQLPIGARSLNGYVSRVTYERSLHASQSSTAPQTRKLDKVRNFLVGKIVQTEARKPVAMKVSAPTKTIPALPENSTVAVPAAAAAAVAEVAEVAKTQVTEQKAEVKAPVAAPIVLKAESSPPQETLQNVVPKAEPQQETAIADDKKISLVKGLGRGAKDLAALKARAVSKTPETTNNTSEGSSGASAAAVVAPTEQSQLDEGKESSMGEQESPRKGKGTGTKDLAAMMARTAKKKDDPPDSDEEKDESKPVATSEAGPTTKDAVGASKPELDRAESPSKPVVQEAGSPSNPTVQESGSPSRPNVVVQEESSPKPKDTEVESSSKPRVEEVDTVEASPTKEERKEAE